MKSIHWIILVVFCFISCESPNKASNDRLPTGFVWDEVETIADYATIESKVYIDDIGGVHFVAEEIRYPGESDEIQLVYYYKPTGGSWQSYPFSDGLPDFEPSTYYLDLENRLHFAYVSRHTFYEENFIGQTAALFDACVNSAGEFATDIQRIADFDLNSADETVCITDNNGMRHCVCQSTGNGTQLYYFAEKDSSWTADLLSDGFDKFEYFNLIFDSDAGLHFYYCSDHINHAWKSAGSTTWNQEELIVVSGPVITTLDNQNGLHATAHPWGGLTHYFYQPAGGNVETMFPDENWNSATPIMLLPLNNTIYITMNRLTGGEGEGANEGVFLYYKAFSTSSWNVEQIAESNVTTAHLYTDSNDEMHAICDVVDDQVDLIVHAIR